MHGLTLTDYGEILGRATRGVHEVGEKIFSTEANVRTREYILTCCFITNHVSHPIPTRRPGGQPGRGPDSTLGKDRPVRGPVTEHQDLPRPGKEHRVFPDDVAAADDGKADLSFSTAEQVGRAIVSN